MAGGDRNREHSARLFQHPARGTTSLHSLFERAVHEQARALTGWGGGLVAFAGAMLASYPTVHHNAAITKLVESYPEAFRSMFGLSDYTTGPGYLRAEVFSLVGPLLIVIMAVLWGSDATAGEEERRTIDVLMANPISRVRVVLEKWAALVSGVALVTGALGVALALGAPLADLRIGLARLAAAVVATALLAILFGTLALAIGAASGHRGISRGITAAAAVASYLVSSLAPLVSWLRPLRPLSPWYHALGVDPLASGFLAWHLLVLVALSLVVIGAAALAFEHRDLGI